MIVTQFSQVRQQFKNYAVARTGIPFPNCVTYATARISDFLGKNIPLDEPNRVAGAGQLLQRHSACFTVSTTPKVGALAVFSSDWLGHVAFVEVVGVNMMITESNYGDYGSGYFRCVEMPYRIGSSHPMDADCRLIGFLVHEDLNPKPQPTGKIGVKVHLQDIGWAGPLWDKAIGDIDGKRLEALQMFSADGTVIEYVDVHIQNLGWIPRYKYPSANTIIGTVGQSLRMEALRMKTSKPCKMRVKYGNGKWSAWTPCDGKAVCGTTGKGMKLLAIEIQRC